MAAAETAFKFALADWLMVALVVSLAYSIVQVPPVPITPSIYLPFCLLYVMRTELRKRGRVVLRRPVLWLTLVLSSYQVVWSLTGTVSYETIAFIGRTIAGMVSIVSLALYARSSPGRFARFLKTLAVVLSISMVWLMLELIVGEPFISLRGWLYQPVYASFLDSDNAYLIDNIRSGLTPFTHQLGFQIAALAPLLMLTFISGRRATGLGVGGLMLVLLACWFSAQRAAIVTVIATVLLMGGLLVRGAKFTRYIAVLAVGGLLATAVIARGGLLTETFDANLGQKLVSESYNVELFFRLQMQAKALELIGQYPLGLDAAGVTWADKGFLPLFFDSDVSYGRIVAVHNAYLADGLKYGWPFFVPALVLLGCLMVAIYRVASWGVRLHSAVGAAAVAVSIAVFNLYFVQSMTHHPSVFTQDPPCILMLAAFVAIESVRVKQRAR